jgi:DNA-binding transcriptional LysR family regulator
MDNETAYRALFNRFARPNDKFDEEWVEAFQDAVIEQSMLLLLAAVREGLGLACLPCYLCERDKTLVRAFDVPAEHCAELWVLRHAHSRENARIRVFAEFLATELRRNILPE